MFTTFIKEIIYNCNNLNIYISLGWLYFIQGIPYGLQDKFIPLQLRAYGLDYSSVGSMKAVLAPWATKGLWAPLLQVYGNTRCLLAGALLVMAVAAFLGSLCDVSGSVRSIAAILLLLNMGCAVQDVLVDGLAMQLLEDKNLGIINSLQVVLYKAGALTGGGGLLMVLSVTSWHSCLLLLAAVYLASAAWAVRLPIIRSTRQQEGTGNTSCAGDVTKTRVDTSAGGDVQKEDDDCNRGVLLDRNKTGGCKEYDDSVPDHCVIASSPVIAEETVKLCSELSQKSSIITDTKDMLNGPVKLKLVKNKESKNFTNYKKISSIFSDILLADGSCWLAVYIVLYKMGERGALNNFPLFMLDSGMSMKELTFWNGTVSQLLSIIGSIYGGIALTQSNANITHLLISHSIQRFIAIVVQMWCIWSLVSFSATSSSSSHLHHYLCIASLCCLSYSSGVISTLTFTLMMRFSAPLPTELRASHYSAFASVEVAGKLAFATVAGVLVDGVGPQRAFGWFAALGSVPIILLMFSPSHLCSNTSASRK